MMKACTTQSVEEAVKAHHSLIAGPRDCKFSQTTETIISYTVFKVNNRAENNLKKQEIGEVCPCTSIIKNGYEVGAQMLWRTSARDVQGIDQSY